MNASESKLYNELNVKNSIKKAKRFFSYWSKQYFDCFDP